MSTVESARLTLAAFCFVPALYFIIINWLVFRLNFNRRRTKNSQVASYIPFFGGLLGAISCALLPFPEIARFWWLFFLIDLGCLIGLTQVVLAWSKHKPPGQP